MMGSKATVRHIAARDIRVSMDGKDIEAFHDKPDLYPSIPDGLRSLIRDQAREQPKQSNG